MKGNNTKPRQLLNFNLMNSNTEKDQTAKVGDGAGRVKGLKAAGSLKKCLSSVFLSLYFLHA